MNEPREVQAYSDITNIRPEGEVDFRPNVTRAEMINHPTAGWAESMTFAERTEMIRRDRALVVPAPVEPPASTPEPVVVPEPAPEAQIVPEPAQEAIPEAVEAANDPAAAAESVEITLEWADSAPETVQANVEETKNTEEEAIVLPPRSVDEIKVRLLGRATAIAEAGQGRELRAELDAQGLPRIGEASLDQLLSIEGTIIEFEAKLRS